MSPPPSHEPENQTSRTSEERFTCPPGVADLQKDIKSTTNSLQGPKREEKTPLTEEDFKPKVQASKRSREQELQG
ncbi:hypothetical protein Tco_0700240 [Tanacetum coccineum]